MLWRELARGKFLYGSEERGRLADSETEEAEEGYRVGGEPPAEVAGARRLLLLVHREFGDSVREILCSELLL